jgi:hypothetical protein
LGRPASGAAPREDSTRPGERAAVARRRDRRAGGDKPSPRPQRKARRAPYQSVVDVQRTRPFRTATRACQGGARTAPEPRTPARRRLDRGAPHRGAPTGPWSLGWSRVCSAPTSPQRPCCPP